MFSSARAKTSELTEKGHQYIDEMQQNTRLARALQIFMVTIKYQALYLNRFHLRGFLRDLLIQKKEKGLFSQKVPFLRNDDFVNVSF